MSLGRLARTIWDLDPRQLAGRVGFQVRRRAWPVVSQLPSLSAAAPALARREALPATAPFDDEDLAALEQGSLRLAGHEARLPEVSPFEPSERDPLYRYQLHEHGWLREAMTRGTPALRARLRDWLARYASARFERGSIAVDPYPLATRVLQWQGLVQLGLIDPDAMAAPMADAARLLFGLSETHLLANHLLRDRAAMLCASRWLGGPAGEWLRPRTARAMADECDAQFLTDGMHEERCPAYHAHATMDVLFALEALLAPRHGRDAGVDRAREALFEHGARAVSALLVVTHADDRVAAFGDSAPLSTPRTSAIATWADALGVRWSRALEVPFGPATRTTLPVAGFTRIEHGDLALFVSHGAFGAPSQPGHAHCDLFALELDVRGRRVIVDPGVHAYHDESLREETRASRSHCTPSVPGEEQAEIWSRFRCGWKPRAIEARWGQGALEAEARAFGPHQPRTLRRRVALRGRDVLVEDRVEGATAIVVALPLAPGLTVMREGPTRARVEGDGELLLTVEVTDGELAVEAAHVSHRFGARVSAERLRLRGTGSVAYTLAPAARAR